MKILLFILLGFNLLAAKEINLSLTVIDQTGKAVPQAECVIQFNQANTGKLELINGLTNADGNFSVKLKTLESLYIEVNKSNYYQSRLYDLSSNQDLTQSIKLIRKLNPTSLHVRYHSGNNSEGLKFPQLNQWYNYDLKIGDWVQPNGRGIITDFKMRLNCDEKSLSNSTVEMEAIEDAAGFYRVDEIISYSELKLPHEAPKNNYVKNILIRGSDWEKYQGIFIRSRVQLNKEGEIITANYSKIQGPITINRRGYLGFTHYHNGVPNNQNLEFDPSQNLLKSDGDLSSPQFEP